MVLYWVSLTKINDKVTERVDQDQYVQTDLDLHSPLIIFMVANGGERLRANFCHPMAVSGCNNMQLCDVYSCTNSFTCLPVSSIYQ